jgi:glycosyltransferase involved in cell wall biosynthesis
MVEKLRILQLVPRFPFPLDDGGKIGIANIYKEFSKQGNEVHLFSLSDENLKKESIIEAEKYGTVHIFKHNTKNSLSRILKYFFLNKSIYLEKHINKQIKDEIRKILSEHSFDVIHADHTCMAPLALFAQSICHIPVGLRLHNIEWTIWQRYCDGLKNYSAQKIFIGQQTKLLKKAEKDIIQKVNINFAITDEDKKRALELAPHSNVTIASAGVNIEEWCPDSEVERNPYELILATTFNWIHNVNAVEWFIKEVMPMVKKEIPEIKLTIIGKNPPKWIENYKFLGVNPVGYVDSVQPYYNQASLNIAPLFVGGGIRIKILEAMAMGLPVVASPVAAEGIKANKTDGLFIADSSNNFYELIVKLLKNQSMMSAFRKTTRNFVQNNYSWKNNVEIMISEYKKIVTKNH